MKYRNFMASGQWAKMLYSFCQKHTEDNCPMITLFDMGKWYLTISTACITRVQKPLISNATWKNGYVMRRNKTWWRHQMETFAALLALCTENPPVTAGFFSHSSVARSFDVSFDRRLNKRLTKESQRRWFETPSCSLWRHHNDINACHW